MRKLLAAFALAALLPFSATAQISSQSSQNIGGQRVLCSIRAANFNSVADQPCALPAGVTKFKITEILVANASTSLTTAVGGVYPTTAKGGTPIVAAAQIYSALTAAGIYLDLTLAAVTTTTPYTVATLYLALTVAQGSAATADFYVIGIDLT